MKILKRILHKRVLVILTIFNIVGNTNSYGQQNTNEIKWFTSLDLGVQMSGIKSEDFVSSNYSPVYRLLLGRKFSPNIGVQMGYQGRYFRAISDDLKYYYNFFFLEGMANLTNLFLGRKNDRKYNLWLHAGPGYFYHEIYERANVHLNLGSSNIFYLNQKLNLKLDVSAIIGWDIYQGNNDILPNISIGLIYKNPFE